MPIQSNTNVSPYFDDFDDKKNFYRMLFKPGFPVQARELSQSQTIINDQIEKLMSRFYNEGDTVVPGNFNIGNPTPYVRISSLRQGLKAKDLIGFEITGVVSGVVAEVLFAEEKTDDHDATLYVSYISSGNENDAAHFQEGESLTSNLPNNNDVNAIAAVGISNISKPIDTPSMGFGSIFTVEEGVYYVSGFAVRNDKQTITLDKYGTEPSYSIGFVVDEDFVNSVEDPSLLDNSQGYSNFAAPGADRLKISLNLTKVEIEGETPPNFIQIIDIINGNIVGDSDKSFKFDWLYDLLATRTFEESGDYIVTEFPIEPLEYWDFRINELGEEVDIEGVFDPDDDGLYPPVPFTGATEKLTFEQADANYAIKVNPGLAYVQGYRVGYKSPFYVYGKKPRTQNLIPSTFTQINPGNNIRITSLYGVPDVSNNRSNINTDAFDTITLYRNFIDGYTGEALNSASDTDDTPTIPMNQGNEPWKTFHCIINGTIDSTDISFDKGNDTIRFVSAKPDGEDDIEGRLILVWPKRNFSTNRDIYGSCVVAIPPEAGTAEVVVKRGDKIGKARVLISTPINEAPAGVVSPKYIQPQNLIEISTGDDNQPDTFYSYDSVHSLGLKNTSFFTELLISPDEATADLNWDLGGLVFGEISRAIAKIERSYRFEKNLIVVSNIIGRFKDGERIFQANAATRTTLEGIRRSNSKKYKVTGIPDESIEVQFEPMRNGIEYQYIRGGHLAVRKLTGRYEITPISSVEFKNDKAIIHPKKNIELKVGDEVVISNVIVAPKIDIPGAKYARLLKPGEVLGFQFNDYIGNPNRESLAGIVIGDRFGPGSGGGENLNSVFTKFVKRKVAESVEYITGDEPVIFNEESAYLNNENTERLITELNEDFIILDRENFGEPEDPDTPDLCPAKLIEDPNGTSILITEGYTTDGAIVFDVDCQDTINPPPDTAESDYDLSDVQCLKVKSLGSTVTLRGADSPRVDIVEGEARPDFDFNPDQNTLELTDHGRAKIFQFPYFAVTDGPVPRVNYEVRVCGNSRSKGVKGYAIVPPSKITNTLKKTKSLWSELSQQPNFSADVSFQGINDGDVVDLADGALFTTTAGRNYIACDNFDGDASEELVAGDLISVVDDEGRVQSKIVQFTTSAFGFGENRSPSIIYTTTNFTGNVTGKSIQRLRLKNFGDPTDSLILQLPVSVVSSIETNPEITGINYTVYREFVTEVKVATDEITLTTDRQNEQFIQDPTKVTITLYQVNDSNITDDEARQKEGRLVSLESSSESNNLILGDGGRDITLVLRESLGVNGFVKVVLPVKVTNGRARKKILVRKAITLAHNPDVSPDSPENPASNQNLSLGVTDAYEIESMLMAQDGADPIDILQNYEFDNGQRDNSYDIATLFRKVGKPIPSGDITITFTYFDHSTSEEGDFFSVDSYTHDQGVSFGKIPVYKPFSFVPEMNVSPNNPSNVIELRDCVDFRSAVNLAGDEPSEIPINSNRVTADCRNYLDEDSGGNGTVPRIPVPGSSFECDIQHYMPKIDSLFLDKSGRMIIKHGIPSEDPVAPADLATGIRLYDMKMPAYLFSPKDIAITKFNYRRYTMKDIYDIDRRVDRVEDLVTLSVLENSALNVSVRDAVTGLDRFKNGIVVDNFRDHSKGDTGSTQYRNSIDPKETHLRAPFYADQVKLEEKLQTDRQREKFGFYQNSNGICTVPYSTKKFIKQPFATRSVNIQPFSTFTYEGSIKLRPPIDTFQDVNTLPDLVIEDNALFSAVQDLADELNELNLGTVWTEWETEARLAANRQNPRGRENRNRNRPDNRGVDSSLLPVGSSTITTTQTRTQTRTSFNTRTAGTVNTSYGERVVDVQLARRMRTRPVLFRAKKLKPNTEYFAFFDGVPVSEWVSVDKIKTDFPDGVNRYSGPPNSDPRGFGRKIVSDDTGCVQGVFLIPNGRPPVTGEKFKRRLSRIEYKKNGPTRSFNTGQRAFRLTSSEQNTSDITAIEGFAETDYVSSGVIIDKQDTIVSTRIPDVTVKTRIREQTREIVEEIPSPEPPPAAPQPRPDDPVAQSFKIDKNNPNGVFVTDLDVFFRTKDPVQGVEAYLVTIEGQTPSQTIVPNSRVVKESNSILRVVCTNLRQSSVTIPAGTVIKGKKSKATGKVKNDIKFERQSANSLKNVRNTVYEVVLENYRGEFEANEELKVKLNPSLPAVFTIAEDEISIDRVDITSMGTGYTEASISVDFDEPDLPGGTKPVATARVVEPSTIVDSRVGQVFEIDITEEGTGYTKTPSVMIMGDGSGATAECRISKGKEAVSMGVATSDDAESPTKFRFDNPIYLLGNVNYAFVIKSPTSVFYTLWTCKIGENQIGTRKKVTSQPNLGSLFLSQDGGLWTEDQTQDIKFTLNRAKFRTDLLSNVRLNNSPFEPIKCPLNPIETGRLVANTTQDDNSTRFNANLRVVKVKAPNHGLISGDFVIIQGVEGQPSNIDDEKFNTMHQVLNSDLHEFTVMIDIEDPTTVKAGSNGGSNVSVICNRAYETVNLYSGVMTFPTSTITCTNRATQFAGTGPAENSSDLYNLENAYVLDTPVDTPIMDSLYYNEPKVIGSTINEVMNSGSLNMNGQKSLETSFVLSTSDNKTSPVIDIDRTNLNVVRTLIDNPKPGFRINAGPRIATIRFSSSIDDFRLVAGQDLGFTTSHGHFRVFISHVDLLQNIIEVTGYEDIDELLHVTTFDNSVLNRAGIEEIDSSESLRFIEETSRVGTTFAKWVSKLFVFENQSDGVEVKVSSIIYDHTNIRAYFRPRTVGFEGEETVNWIPFNENQPKPNEVNRVSPDGTVLTPNDTNYNTNLPLVATPGLPDNVDLIKPRDTENVDPRLIMPGEWQEITWTIQDIAKFDALAIKLVLTQSNPAISPLIDDIQIICSE